jgi:hypothetical protein
MIEKVCLFSMLAVILCLGLVEAGPYIKIDINNVFYVNDSIGFSYEIFGFEDYVLNGNEVIKFVPRISCSELPAASIDEREANVSELPVLKGNYIYGRLGSGFSSANCSASINILEPFFASDSVSFRIESTEKIPFLVFSCKDSECNEKAKVFLKGQNIYLKYNSEIEGLSIRAELKYPDEHISQVDIPSSLKAETIGSYELYVIASKAGYAAQEARQEFAVINENAEIKDNAFGTGIESGSDANKQTKKGIYLIYILAVLILVLAIVVYWRLKRKNFNYKV